METSNVFYLPDVRRRDVDRHHILFDRVSWTASKVRSSLRNNQWLVPPITRETHENIHRAIEIVPTLDHHTLTRVQREFEPVPGDYVASAENLCEAIDLATLNRQASKLQRELGGLAVYAIEIQLPFIREEYTDDAA